MRTTEGSCVCNSAVATKGLCRTCLICPLYLHFLFFVGRHGTTLLLPPFSKLHFTRPCAPSSQQCPPACPLLVGVY